MVGTAGIGYDGKVFYLGLALNPKYVEGVVEGYLERIGEVDPEEKRIFRDLWEDETQREEEVENAVRDHMKYEMRTTRGYYRNGLLDTVRIVSISSRELRGWLLSPSERSDECGEGRISESLKKPFC